MNEAIRKEIMRSVQGAGLLHIAYVGVTNHLFQALAAGAASAAILAERTERDLGYVKRWCDAAYAFGLLDEAAPDEFVLTELGAAFDPEAKGSLFPAAIQVVLGAHFAERASGLMQSGERPGEVVLTERDSILPWFGPMLEASFAPVFETHVVPAVPIFAEVDARGGLAVDLGCGNGWYLRRLAKRCSKLRGVGLDAFEANIEDAGRRASAEGMGDRLSFQIGDLHHFDIDEPADLIAMNRALHHVWDDKENVFRILFEHLRPGGAAVIWEPVWPDTRAPLREPARRGVAFQNLAEHVQGNHFLRPSEIADELMAVGLEPEVHLLLEGREAVIVGRKPGG